MTLAISALVSHYPAIINQMPTLFTAHEFIQKLTQQHQALYIEVLYHYKNSDEPFTVVHSQLGSHLNDFPNLVVKNPPDVPGINIFGNHSTVSQWKKL